MGSVATPLHTRTVTSSLPRTGQAPGHVVINWEREPRDSLREAKKKKDCNITLLLIPVLKT